MINNDFQQLVSSYLNPNNQIRVNAEKELNNLLSRGDPNDLDILFDSLNNFAFNNEIKLFLSLLIKKIFETCIYETNIQHYRLYIQTRKENIINTILNINSNLRVVKLLVISLCKAIHLFSVQDNESDMSHMFSFQDVFRYIFEFYIKQKESTNNNHSLIFQSLFISFTLLKYIQKDNIKINIWSNDSFVSFYDQIIADYKNLTNSLCLLFQSSNPYSFTFEVNLQYLCLYLKISKYSLNVLNKEQREQIMDITYNLLNSLLAFILNSKSTTKENSQLNNSKFYFDCIFLSNKILIKYTGYVSKIDLITIQKYSDLFYIYIRNRQTFISICNLIKNSGEYSNNNDPEYKLSKFVINIIDFFRELLQLISLSNWGDLIIFRDCYSDECIKIRDYLSQHFFTEDKMKELLLFSIQNCLTFKIQEINMAICDAEEFYNWYDSLSPMVDLRQKAGVLCRIIYERYKKDIKEFICSLEIELINLIQKEMTFLHSNTPKTSLICLSFDEINLKCALLSFFETIAVYYYNKKSDYDKWINSIFLSQLDLHITNANNSEMFSKFIIIRILTTIIDFKEVEPYKLKVFSAITNIFFNTNAEDIKKLLSLASIDFFYAFFDDIMPVEFPINFFHNYIYKVCELLKNTSNPDIHSKTIKSTHAIINQCSDEDINSSFSLIFPILNYLWDNNWNEYLKQSQMKESSVFHSHLQKAKICHEIDKVRQNLIQLISIFVKRVGLFVNLEINKLSKTTQNNDSIVDKKYFQFIYHLIGFSINVKTNESSNLLSEGFRIILFIQDEYFESSIMKTNNSFKDLKTLIENGSFFQYYVKMYDYIPIILDNLYFSNDYIIIQLFIIEQLISLLSIELISSFLIQYQFIEKIIFICSKIKDNQLLNDYHQIIFNFMEYLLYVINTYSTIPLMQINQYNDFIYQFIMSIFNEIEDNAIASIQQIKEEPLLDHIQLSIFIGAIQLANRLLYVNMKNKLISVDYTILISKKVSLILLNKNLVEIINSIQTDIISKTLINLNNILMKNKEQVLLRDTDDILIASFIHQEYSLRKQSHYLNQQEKILSTWLYFFNKMNNKSYYYNLSASEDKMRLIWSSKLEKMLIGDISNIDFKIKYYFLYNDDINALE